MVGQGTHLFQTLRPCQFRRKYKFHDTLENDVFRALWSKFQLLECVYTTSDKMKVKDKQQSR
jgi:hypothetical protein